MKEHQDKTGVAEKRTLFVSNVPRAASKQYVHDLFESCGGVESVSVSRVSDDPTSTRFAHVVFLSAKSVRKALALDTPRPLGWAELPSQAAREEGTPAALLQHEQASIFEQRRVVRCHQELPKPCSSTRTTSSRCCCCFMCGRGDDGVGRMAQIHARRQPWRLPWLL